MLIIFCVSIKVTFETFPFCRYCCRCGAYRESSLSKHLSKLNSTQDFFSDIANFHSFVIETTFFIIWKESQFFNLRNKSIRTKYFRCQVFTIHIWWKINYGKTWNEIIDILTRHWANSWFVPLEDVFSLTCRWSRTCAARTACWRGGS